MALDATVGGASSNSYGTLEEADDHFEDRPERLSWAALKMAQESWLIAATDVMETFTYQGRRAYTDQALSFPRSGLALDGIRLDADVIPVLVKRAQFVLALWLSEQDVLRDAVEDLDAFERLRVDVIELVPIGFT